MILTLLFYAFLAYMLYRLVFGFIIPIVRTTRRVKRSFRDMQEKMNAQYGGRPAAGRPEPAVKTPKGDNEDYIEFEEVK